VLAADSAQDLALHVFGINLRAMLKAFVTEINKPSAFAYVVLSTPTSQI